MRDLVSKEKGEKANLNATLGFLGLGSSESLAGNVLGLTAPGTSVPLFPKSNNPRLRTLDIASAVATSPSGPLRS